MSGSARARIERLIPALGRYAHDAVDGTGTPGVTVALADRSGLVWEGGFGLANLAETRLMDAANVMRAGSMAKLQVATAAMQLVDAGLIDLYAPVERYTAGIAVRNPLGPRPVSVYDLLTYRSGLRTDTFDARFTVPDELAAYLAAVYQRGRGREYGGIGELWTADVGRRYQYSSLGMATLGHVVAVMNPHGDTYSEYVAREIFAPLGMQTSAVPAMQDRGNVSVAMLDACTTGYATWGGLGVPTPTVHSATYPATGLMTTAGDQARWLAAMMAGGADVLAPDTVRAMLTPHADGKYPGEREGLYVGLGVQMRNPGRQNYYFGHRCAYPFGWWGDARAYPHLGVVVVAFTNSWDLLRYTNPEDRIAPGLICESVAAWMTGDEEPLRRGGPLRTRVWRSAYALGLLMGDRLLGVLGIEDPLTKEAIVAMVDGTRPTGGPGDTAWDRDGFVSGVTAVAEVARSGGDVRAFLASDACAVAGEDLNLEALIAGASRAELPVPMAFYSERREEDAARRGHVEAIG